MPEWIRNAADIIGVLGSAFALFAWIQSRRVSKQLKEEKERRDQKIRVVLSHESMKLELPVEMRRGEFTRAEILGRIGMIPLKATGGRYELSHFNTPDFLTRVNKIADGSGPDTLIIPCSREEFEQFKI
jgi:hypothetical protein